MAILGALLALGFWGSSRAFAQASREYDLKAVFLYNLATFVEWPASAFATPEAPFVIGVFGSDPFGRALDEVVTNEYIGRRPITIRRFRSGEDVTGCHLLFIPNTEARRLPEVLRSVRGRPVLTVGDRPGFIEAGGMVNFAIQAERLRLFVNVRAARAVELVVSSKLLEVAQVVEDLAALR